MLGKLSRFITKPCGHWVFVCFCEVVAAVLGCPWFATCTFYLTAYWPSQSPLQKTQFLWDLGLFCLRPLILVCWWHWC